MGNALKQLKPEISNMETFSEAINALTQAPFSLNIQGLCGVTDKTVDNWSHSNKTLSEASKKKETSIRVLRELQQLFLNSELAKTPAFFQSLMYQPLPHIGSTLIQEIKENPENKMIKEIFMSKAKELASMKILAGAEKAKLIQEMAEANGFTLATD